MKPQVQQASKPTERRRQTMTTDTTTHPFQICTDYITGALGPIAFRPAATTRLAVGPLAPAHRSAFVQWLMACNWSTRNGHLSVAPTSSARWDKLAEGRTAANYLLSLGAPAELFDKWYDRRAAKRSRRGVGA